jgi:arylsulfate sulfotransferase
VARIRDRLLLFLISSVSVCAQSFDVVLAPSVPAPAPVGTVVAFTAIVSGGSGAFWYRFRIARPGLGFRVIEDFSPSNQLNWTASQAEGTYQIEVTARDNNTQATAVSTLAYRFVPAVTGSDPVISPTANPLVFLYSAPVCAAGARMRVEFQAPGEAAHFTPYQNCSPPCPDRGRIIDLPSRHPGRQGIAFPSCSAPTTMNFYLAGLRPETTYLVNHIIDFSNGEQMGPQLSLTTPPSPFTPPALTLSQPAPSTSAGLLLHNNLFGPSFATDLAGNLVWYYSTPVTFLTEPEPGGRFLSLTWNPTGAPVDQIFREFDVAGTTLRETNAARVNEQLTALGVRNITSFHHDARSLPGGGVVLLGSTEQIMTGVQGPGPVDVIGDLIIALDQDLHVVWTWDAFDHLDPHRMATLGETCPGSGCPPYHLAAKANDWVHGNALQYLDDGNLLYSSRHQDWVMKIDYEDGKGSGDVLWRLGPDGDFQIISTDPSPWFSHQHDPDFVPGDETVLTVYDDGNLREAVDPHAHSRGQVLLIDETAMTATLTVNVDLGAFSFALGSAQFLPDGNYQFGGGWILPSNTSNTFEADPSGNFEYSLHSTIPEYRTYRIADLYNP